MAALIKKGWMFLANRGNQAQKFAPVATNLALTDDAGTFALTDDAGAFTLTNV